MQTADLFLDVEQRIAAAEQQLEDVKAQLLEEDLSCEQFVRRRAHAREIGAWLGDLHEVRRHIARAVYGAQPLRGDRLRHLRLALQ